MTTIPSPTIVGALNPLLAREKPFLERAWLEVLRLNRWEAATGEAHLPESLAQCSEKR